MTARILALLALFAVAATASWLAPRLTSPPDRATLGRELLAEGRFDDAAALFDSPAWRGVAEHRAGRHLRSAGSFLEEETPETLYNAGVAYARLHEWGAARAAFLKTLRLEPGHEDARHNLAVIERAEAAERRLIAEAAATEETAGRESGDLRTVDAPGPAEGEELDGAARSGAKKAAATESDAGGRSEEAGAPGETPRAAQAGAGPVGGAADGDAPPLEGLSAAALSLRRESAQAAEILLRRIADDPERVLRARFRAAHERRRAREGAACAGC